MAAILVFGGCKSSEEQLGLDVLPDGDMIDVKTTDTFSVQMSTHILDSILFVAKIWH